MYQWVKKDSNNQHDYLLFLQEQLLKTVGDIFLRKIK